MVIKQFEDKPLAHYSYAIISDGKMAVIDPARNPMPYYIYAEERKARIVAVFETHPHADFVSSHLQIHEETNATIYVSKLVGANYPHQAFDDGDSMTLGTINLEAIHTPGHSPDSISIIATDENRQRAMFSGDTLFIGDVGRPDLREKAGNMKAKRKELAKMMYNTVKTKFNHLPDDTLVYPAHGAGSLCGKNMSSDASSTLGNERRHNWAFKDQTEDEFVKNILSDQPFIPSYFGYNVDLNKTGAAHHEKSVAEVPLQLAVGTPHQNHLIVDVRDQEAYKNNHFPNSINIMARNENDKLETWLGTIIRPDEKFYLIVSSVEDKNTVVNRIAKIGYETHILGVFTMADETFETSKPVDTEVFKNHQEQYTILDIRNTSEVDEKTIFKSAINIPLNELRDAEKEIPRDKPIVVHCAGGYRSAAGSSIVEQMLDDVEVYDLGDAVKNF